MAADGQPILPRHHDVENDEIRSAALQEPTQRGAVLGDADAIAVLAQVLADEIANVAMVIDQGNVRCGIHGVVQPTSELLQCAESRPEKSLSECVDGLFWDTR